MTNEELKKKIIEVIDCLWIDYPPESDEVADALIAAGIGDVSELEVKCEVLQRDVDNLTRTMEEGREELEEAKHRAETVETALKYLIKDNSDWCFMNMDCDIARCGGIEYGSDRCIDILVDNAIKRAEKELAEGGIDGKNFKTAQ